MRKIFLLISVTLSSLAIQAQVICGGSNAVLNAPNQGAPGATHTLLPGGFNSPNGTYTVTPGTTSTYTLLTTYQGTSGPTTTSLVTTVTVNPMPVAVPSLTQATCTNSNNALNLNLTFNPPTNPTYTIAWSTVPPSVLSPQQTTATPLTPGAYSTSITAQGGCSVEVTFTFNPQPAPADYTLTPFGSIYTITCLQPSVEISVSNQNYTYTWTSVSQAPSNNFSITLNSQSVGNHTVVGLNPLSGCTKTYTFSVGINTTVPSSTITPFTQNITCSVNSVATFTAFASPTVNITHLIQDPSGGIFAANQPTTIYNGSGTGVYTHSLLDNASGCYTTKTFTITSSLGFPTFSLTSPNSFTLGCNSLTCGIINLTNGQTTPSGGSLSYTLLGPPTSSATVPGTLSSQTSYTVCTAGTWTAITKDNTNNCERRSVVSVIEKKQLPDISAMVPRQVLTCYDPTLTLIGQSETPNVTFSWTKQIGTPPVQPGAVITTSINSVAPTTTVVNVYTLNVVDNSSTCRSTSVVPIYQNIFPPNTGFSHGGVPALTCGIPTVVLTNTSTTTIPSHSLFTSNLPVIGYLWQGPSPMPELQVSTTYIGSIVGVYTLTGLDRNNGCTKTATLNIQDNRIYPTLNNPNAPPTAVFDCGSNSATVTVIITNPTPNLTYSWTAPVPVPGSTNTVRDFQTTALGVHTVVVTNTVNNCVSTATANVVQGSLSAMFTPDVERGYAPLTVRFTNQSSSASASTGTANIRSIWSFGNQTVSVLSPTATGNPVEHTFHQPGTYTVVLYASKGACLDSTFKTIIVDIPSRLTVPNVFTPNGDGVNDEFFLLANNISSIDFVVHDRWGHKVYELIGAATGNVVWNGQNQAGKDCAEGVYYYVLTATGGDGKPYEQKGSITLLR